MPWLIAAALLHSAVVVEKRDALKAWTILLAILAFGFSLIGTFIVRSGVLTSVHAFANDPERGVFILTILALAVGGSLILFALRAGAMESRSVFSTVSRETALVANNLLLAVSCCVVFVGTVWPLVAELFFDRRLSVGPPFFNLAFTPFMIGLAIILPIGSALPWKRARLGSVLRRLWPVAVLAVALCGLVWAVQSGRSLLGPMGLALGVWVVVGAVLDGVQGRGLRRADVGKAVAHAGLGVTLFAVAALTAWEEEGIAALTPGQSLDVGGYTFTLQSVKDGEGPNYLRTRAVVDISRGGALVATVTPERRFYPVAAMPTTEVGMRGGLWRDLYVVVGEEQPGGGIAVRVFIKPFANWIWIGVALMALGGGISLSDRRLRVGVGRARAIDTFRG